MELAETKLSDADLDRQRAAIRRGLVRANAAAAIILVVVVGLAIAAIIQAYRAETNMEVARAASQRAEAEHAKLEWSEREVREKLWQSYKANARSSRLSGRVGARTEGLEAIAAAARIHPATELRSEAIALLAMTDLQVEVPWHKLPNGASVPIFDADLSRYAVGIGTGSLGVFRVGDDRELVRFYDLSSPVIWIRFSPNGQFLATRQANSEIRVWNLSASNLVLNVKGAPHAGLDGAIDFSPDSRFFAAYVHEQTVSVFELASGQEIKRIPCNVKSASLRFDPSGQILAVGAGSEIQILEVVTGQKLRVLRLASSKVRKIFWHPTGRQLAAAADDESIYLFEIETGKHRKLSGQMGGTIHVAFNNRGDLLVSDSLNGDTRLWDGNTGDPLLTTDTAFASYFSQDDRRLGCVKRGIGPGVWRVLPSVRPRIVHIPEAKSASSMDLSPNGKFLALLDGEALLLRDLEQEPIALHQNLAELHIGKLQPGSHTVQFHPDGKRLLVSGSSGTHLLSLNTNASNNTWRWEEVQSGIWPGNAPVSCANFTPDGSMLWFVSDGQLSRVKTDAPDRLIARATAVPRQFQPVAMSPDGRWVVDRPRPGSGLELCDLLAKQQIQSFGDGDTEVIFTPDSRLLLARTKTNYVAFAPERWREQWRLTRQGQGDSRGAFAVSPDGKLVAVTLAPQNVQLLEPATGFSLAALELSPSQIITRLVFTPAGILAGWVKDDLLMVWDLERIGAELSKLGLGWDIAPPQFGFLPSPSSTSASRALPRRAYTHSLSIALAVAAVLLALIAGSFSLRRHVILIRQLVHTEQMVAERNLALEEAQSQVVQSQKMKALGTLAAGIAHDFNNLLSVIRMSNKLIGREAGRNAEVCENVQAIEHAVQQGKSVVRSMLGYSRDSVEDIGRFSAVELAEDVVALLSRQFLSGIALTLELDRDTPLVCGAKARLEQVLLNLVVNAAEAMKGRGKLLIAVRPKGPDVESYVVRPRSAESAVELVVQDSGPGIAPEIRDRIFEPFFTTKKAGTARGTGLGLATVYLIAQEDGLGLSVDSVVGKGSTFRITLPVI